MSAQLVDNIEEVVFTDAEEGIFLVLADKTVIEFFGDGTYQKRGPHKHEVVVAQV